VFYELDQCNKHSDGRGNLIEFLRRSDLNEMPDSFGQIYFVTFDAADQVRGNHYHENAYEAFGIVSGVLEVVLEDVRSHERFEVVLNSDDHLFTRLKIGPYVAHAFRNISPTAILLNYSTEQFNPVRPDRLDYLLIDPAGAKRTLLANR
jgi:dTDP-4-dehydrorhamnose 3,5-epimerase